MSIAVVMPAWNEAQGIAGFLTELHDALLRWEPIFIVVNDCSTDETAKVAGSVGINGIDCRVYTNPRNLGHGPSTLRALQLGLELSPEAVVAIDGDGQFVGADVAAVVERLLASRADVVEGVRRERGDPLYRRMVSATTRTLVWTRAHERPADANTPLRAYRPDVLARLVRTLPSSASTPNLLISALCRQWGLRVVELPVRSIPRRGPDKQGSTWQNRRASLPSKRFVRFCANAAREWVTTPTEGVNP